MQRDSIDSILMTMAPHYDQIALGRMRYDLSKKYTNTSLYEIRLNKIVQDLIYTDFVLRRLAHES